MIKPSLLNVIVDVPALVALLWNNIKEARQKYLSKTDISDAEDA